ncbi:HAMP domain-containing histidine kinase [Enterococcus hulanensis]|nr:HAMP domain-containing sensor histidine kinase [Enterococcus hulanensis]MBO0410169.1 HAMP domain-containing histidine kinase [Enterococcus hulanensis]
MPIVIILIIIIVSLVFSIFLLKRDIKKIDLQLRDMDLDRNQLTGLSLADTTVNSLAETINRTILNQKEERIAEIKKERELKETISNISHDLRTPLTAIIGYLQLLEREALSKDQREFVRVSLEKSMTMKNLTQSFFELSYYESQNIELDLRKINLSNLVIEGILQETSNFEKYTITPKFDIQEDCWVYKDERLLVRLLQNLISNVLQHGKESVHFVLSQKEETILTITNKYDNKIEIDTGKLFHRFYISDKSRNSKGNGLGLAIVKALSERLNINVSASVEEDLFTIRLVFN